ncbi:protein of unknown function [Shewanella benthica]|uniref:Uncharacterized protein n=1 Tax=Shewanella benthica TaxID=43661 RepID=A0A330M745_9GAMM|nr:protein of unknown function [Shewanella benthica]
MQVCAGQLQLSHLQKISCRDHELLTRHHDDTFYALFQLGQAANATCLTRRSC